MSGGRAMAAQVTPVDRDVSIPAPTPGKQTQVDADVLPTSADAIGNDYAQRGAYCATTAATECFLTPAERDNVMLLRMGRIAAAQVACNGAFTEQLVLEYNLPEEEPEVYFIMGLEALTGVVGGAAGKLFQLAHSAPAHALAEVTTISAGARAIAATAIRRVDEAAVEQGVELAMGTVKETARHLRREDIIQAEQGRKAKAALLVHAMQDLAAQAFEAIREHAITSQTSDAVLLLEFASWRVDHGHRPSDYRTAVAKKFEDLKASGVDDIGARSVQSVDQDDAREIGVQTTVRRYVDPTGAVRLALHRQTTADGEIGPDEFVRWIPDDFADDATLVYTSKYGAPPPETHVDYPHDHNPFVPMRSAP